MLGVLTRLQTWVSKRASGEWLVRAVVPPAVVASVALGIVLPHHGDLPSSALGTTLLLYGERAIGIFFGFLLLFVPFVRGMRGQVPVELSFQGAKYEASAASSEALKALNDDVRRQESVVAGLATAVESTVQRVGSLEDAVSGLTRPAE